MTPTGPLMIADGTGNVLERNLSRQQNVEVSLSHWLVVS